MTNLILMKAHRLIEQALLEELLRAICRSNSLVQIDRMENVLDCNDRVELKRLNEDFICGHVANAHLDQVLIVCELNACYCLEGLQGLKLKLLVIGFDDSIVLQIECVIPAAQLSLISMDILHLVLSQLGQLSVEVLRRVIKLDKHTRAKTFEFESKSKQPKYAMFNCGTYM